MKIFVMKLAALLVLLGAGFSLLVQAGVPQAVRAHTLLHTKVLGVVDKRLGVEQVAFCATLGLIGLALWGLMPNITDRRRRYIRFEGAEGPVYIYLDPVERQLREVIGRMPEVRTARIHVRPDRDNIRALIDVEVVLEQQQRLGARDTANLVAHYIRETTRNMLGLHDLAVIDMHVTGLGLDAQAAALKLQEDASGRIRRGLDPAPDLYGVTIHEKVDLDGPLAPLAREPIAARDAGVAPFANIESAHDVHAPDDLYGPPHGEYEHPASESLLRSSELLDKLETSAAAAELPEPEPIDDDPPKSER